MTDPPTDEPQHRAYTTGQAELREVDDQSDNGLMRIRMPIASTGEVRNEGDEPLTRDELDGMARQINERDVGVFLAHGDSTELTNARYGQTERLGNWQEAEVIGGDEREDGESDLLMADAVMPDPETLPDGVKNYREVLGILKEQAKREIGMSASIGWREDDDAPGGNDLMEASIVGIPADPRTVTQGGPAAAVARAAVDAGADPEALVEAVRSAVTGDRDPATETDHDMTEDEDTEPDAENEAAGADDADESTERAEAPEWASRLLEMQEAQTDTLQSIADALREEDEDDDDDDDDEEDNESDDDEDEDEEDEDEENSQDADVTADQREALETLREGGFNVDDLDLPEPDTDDEQDADADDDESATRDTDSDDEDATKALLRS